MPFQILCNSDTFYVVNKAQSEPGSLKSINIGIEYIFQLISYEDLS